MTFLTPILVAGFYGLVAWLVINQNASEKARQVAVYDPSGHWKAQLIPDEKVIFIHSNFDFKTLQEKTKKEEFDALLIFPEGESVEVVKEIQIVSSGQPGLGLVKSIEKKVENIQSEARMKMLNLTKEQIEKSKGNIKIRSSRIKDGNTEESNAGIQAMAGYISSLLIYVFILLYGVQVMRGVIEEKTNRIVEVLVSSVRPFQLMLGKIIGITLVALTQFSLWIVLSIVNISVLGSSASKLATSNVNTADASELSDALNQVMNLNFPLIIGCFIFFFVTGFLFYGAFFAAIGSAVDNETDTQQFMWPVTIPLILGLVIAVSTVWENPNSLLLEVLSFVPFTAPIVMAVRIPSMNDFASHWPTICGSMAMMVLGFLGAVWIAARIYRTGILMYGKKPSFKEIGKWLFYRG